jgi:hypothetical protein
VFKLNDSLKIESGNAPGDASPIETKQYILRIDGQHDVVVSKCGSVASIDSGFETSDRDEEGTCSYDQAAILESLLLSLALDDFDIADPAFVKSINSALENQSNLA